MGAASSAGRAQPAAAAGGGSKHEKKQLPFIMSRSLVQQLAGDHFNAPQFEAVATDDKITRKQWLSAVDEFHKGEDDDPLGLDEASSSSDDDDERDINAHPDDAQQRSRSSSGGGGAAAATAGAKTKVKVLKAAPAPLPPNTAEARAVQRKLHAEQLFAEDRMPGEPLSVKKPLALPPGARRVRAVDRAHARIGDDGIPEVNRLLDEAAAVSSDDFVTLNLDNNALTWKGIQLLTCSLPPSLQGLRLCENPELEDGGVKVLCGGILRAGGPRDTLRLLALAHCSITAAGAVSLAAILKNLPALEELNLHGNPELHDDGLVHLSRAIVPHLGLRTLKASACDLSAACAVDLQRMLETNKTLQNMYLGENPRLGSKGVEVIADGLTRNFGVERIFLESCEVGNDGAAALALAIRKNRLKEVYLVDNPAIGKPGRQLLQKALNISRAAIRLDVNEALEAIGADDADAARAAAAATLGDGGGIGIPPEWTGQ